MRIITSNCLTKIKTFGDSSQNKKSSYPSWELSQQTGLAIKRLPKNFRAKYDPTMVCIRGGHMSTLRQH